jgi:hypothetical protein
MDLIKLLTALLYLEIIARIVGPKDHGPYLLSFTGAEPMTDFERVLYDSMAVPDE